jgi:hypothetical protein
VRKFVDKRWQPPPLLAVKMGGQKFTAGRRRVKATATPIVMLAAICSVTVRAGRGTLLRLPSTDIP